MDLNGTNGHDRMNGLESDELNCSVQMNLTGHMDLSEMKRLQRANGHERSTVLGRDEWTRKGLMDLNRKNELERDEWT